MSESSGAKIPCVLCHDHFERLVVGDVCATCPSRLENADVVKAASKVYGSDKDQASRAVVTELQSIRRAQAEFHKLLDKTQAAIFGNGKPGLEKRLTIIETKLATSRGNLGTMIAVVGVIISCVLSIVGLMK